MIGASVGQVPAGPAHRDGGAAGDSWHPSADADSFRRLHLAGAALLCEGANTGLFEGLDYWGWRAFVVASCGHLRVPLTTRVIAV